MKLNKKREGIALASLVLTIIIVIILASVGVGIVINKNYFGKAEDMKFSSNIRNYMEELHDYIENEEFVCGDLYNQTELFADKDGIYYNGEKLKNKNIKDIITTISDEDLDDIKVYKGKIVYVGGTKEYQKQVNEEVSYFNNKDMVANVSKNIDDNTTKIEEVEANINNTSFSVEVIFSEINTKTDDKHNFIYSDVFNIYNKGKNKTVYVGDSSTNTTSNFNLRSNIIDKVTFTYDKSSNQGSLYINGNLACQTIFLNKLSQFDKIYLKGDKNYYEVRVYDKCLNYSQIKQNDIVDTLKYGIWSDN